MPRWIAALIALTVGAGGCGDDGGSGYSVVRSPDYAFPGDTLEDWVSRGDQLSVISVLDETRPEPWPAYKNSGGLAGREVIAGRPSPAAQQLRGKTIAEAAAAVAATPPRDRG